MTAAPITRPISRPPAARPETRPPAHGKVTFGNVPAVAGQRIVVFGPGGSGKTTLAAMAPGPVGFFDFDESLPVLKGQLSDVDLRVVSGVASWQDLRDALHAPGWDEVKTIVIDSMTKCEELAADWIIRTVPHEKGNKVTRLGDYPYGAGYRFAYDELLKLLGDLDQHVRAGRNVVLICHESTEKHPNPAGEDWLRSEPRLQHSAKASVRERVRDWCDSLIFIGYDLDVQKGKGKGTGTRTVYPCELPHCMAKSRTVTDPLPLIKGDRTVWNQLLGVKAE